jgi:uncharacterized protein YbjT (DUF2867 family)
MKLTVMGASGLIGSKAADVLVDVTNSPSFEDDPVLQFFTTSAANLTAAAKVAGVGHYVALSIVGVDGLPESGYMRAKVAQEPSRCRTPSSSQSPPMTLRRKWFGLRSARRSTDSRTSAAAELARRRAPDKTVVVPAVT